MGRFTSQDSFLGEINDPPSLHRYFYGNANPLRYIDPTGHQSQPANPTVSPETIQKWEEFGKVSPLTAGQDGQPAETSAPVAQVVTEENVPGSGLGETLANAWNKFTGAASAARDWVQEQLTARTKKGLNADQGPIQETLERADALAPPGSSATIEHTMSREQLEQRSGDTLRAAKESLAEHTGYGGGIVAEKAVEAGQAKVVQVGVQAIAPVVVRVGKSVPKPRRGSGPRPGFIEVSRDYNSSKAIQNFRSETPTDFIYDHKSDRFVLGANYRSRGRLMNRGHDEVANAAGISTEGRDQRIVGGRLSRQDGALVTDEFSGHYGPNWTPPIREKFVQFMKEHGVEVKHNAWRSER